MHITASVFINDDESGCTRIRGLAGGARPGEPYSAYRHNGYEDNADAT